MWACAVLGFRPDEARNWTRYAFASRWGVEGRSPDESRACQSVFAKYLAIAHIEADALLTVDPEPGATAEKVTRAASIQDPGAIE